MGGGGVGVITLTSSQAEFWAEFYGCINYVSNDQSLQWQSLEYLTVCFSFASSIMSNSILYTLLQGVHEVFA